MNAHDRRIYRRALVREIAPAIAEALETVRRYAVRPPYGMPELAQHSVGAEPILVELARRLHAHPPVPFTVVRWWKRHAWRCEYTTYAALMLLGPGDPLSVTFDAGKPRNQVDWNAFCQRVQAKAAKMVGVGRSAYRSTRGSTR